MKVKARLGSSYRKLFAATVSSNLGDGVGQIAYPWLASAITRNPVLIALVAVTNRLPWLLFTLPAGVITDRVDRRKAMVLMDCLRGALTLAIAFLVLGDQSSLPSLDEIDSVTSTRTGLYLAVLLATLLLGMAEVLRDNSGQTIMPALVEPQHLERANGRMWAAESVAGTFVGPPLGSFLLAIGFALPFFLDAGTFFVAAALVALIPGTFRAERDADAAPAGWRADLAEGVRWLWGHSLLRPMAITLGLMNAAAMVSGGVFVLFAQEVLGASAVEFAILTMGGAIGAVVGGTAASFLSKKLGSGTCLAITLGGSTALGIAMAFTRWWPVAMVIFAIESMLGILWNVITVSLRQTIIPPHLLGRVNSVYRFFAWGMMPVGAALGGLVVFTVGTFASRDTALRATWFVHAAIYAGLFIVARSRLTTERIEAARREVGSPPVEVS